MGHFSALGCVGFHNSMAASFSVSGWWWPARLRLSLRGSWTPLPSLSLPPSLPPLTSHMPQLLISLRTSVKMGRLALDCCSLGLRARRGGSGRESECMEMT